MFRKGNFIEELISIGAACVRLRVCVLSFLPSVVHNGISFSEFFHGSIFNRTGYIYSFSPEPRICPLYTPLLQALFILQNIR